ncbi:MAG TPA: class I SAM-dependent methyltransferase [Candidatus Nanoarchaeia archaeon]|nr:class I SAM-dependent methyltransferase [Candidatus Nanoarchaeia archaeon]
MKKQSMFEEVPCNICGSTMYRIIYPAQRNKTNSEIDEFHASGDEPLVDQLVKCNRCGLIYVNPRLRQDIVIKGYSEGSDERFVSQAEARERTFDRALNKIEKYATKGKILDVGTAGGSFLAAAQKRGWIVQGCEPNKWLAAWGRKRYSIPIDTGTLHDQRYPSDSYNAVTLWDVIEHTSDPAAVFHECNRILKKKGILVVNYPDIGSIASRIMGSRWVFLLSVHLYYFTPKTMQALLKKEGFEVIYRRPHLQKLQLGYLLTRAGAYIPFLVPFGKKLANILGIEKKQVPYWIGQTFIIARKVAPSRREYIP